MEDKLIINGQVYRRVKDELTVVDELKNYPETFEVLDSPDSWEEYYTDDEEKIEVIVDDWDSPDLDGEVYLIKTNGKFYEIVRRKQSEDVD